MLGRDFEDVKNFSFCDFTIFLPEGICSHKSIENSCTAIVSFVVRMMEAVEVHLFGRIVKRRVSLASTVDRQNHPNEPNKRIETEQDGSAKNRKDVANQKFNRVSIFACPGFGDDEFVMSLVDVFVGKRNFMKGTMPKGEGCISASETANQLH